MPKMISRSSGSCCRGCRSVMVPFYIPNICGSALLVQYVDVPNKYSIVYTWMFAGCLWAELSVQCNLLLYRSGEWKVVQMSPSSWQPQNKLPNMGSVSLEKLQAYPAIDYAHWCLLFFHWIYFNQIYCLFCIFT